MQVGDEYLGLEQRYKLVTKAYIGKGKDGYDSLAQGEVSSTGTLHCIIVS